MLQALPLLCGAIGRSAMNPSDNKQQQDDQIQQNVGPSGQKPGEQRRQAPGMPPDRSVGDDRNPDLDPDLDDDEDLDEPQEPMTDPDEPNR
jgi:hypothetical protein